MAKPIKNYAGGVMGFAYARPTLRRKTDSLDVTGKLLLAVGVAAAIYLIAAPLAMLLFAAFRGPTDFLPFEPGARANSEHIARAYPASILYRLLLPDAPLSLAGTDAP